MSTENVRKTNFLSKNTFTAPEQKKEKRNDRKMYLKVITKSYNIFRDHPVWSEQNKNIAGNLHSTQNRKKQTAKHN